MAKITSLTTDNGIGIYYEKAMDKYDEGDFVGCLELLFIARDLLQDPYGEDDLTLLLEIADTYSEMGLFYESNKYYYILTQYSYSLDEVYYSIIRNFILMGNAEAAVGYLNFAMEVGLLSPEDNISVSELESFMKPPAEKFRLLKEQDSEYLVQVAKQLVNSHDTEFAKQVLGSVSPQSKHYVDASNFLAILEVGGGNAEKGIEYCDGILETKPDDVGAITTKIVGKNMLGDEREVKELTERLLELDISDVKDLSKAAMCMAELKNSALTAKFCEKVLREEPFERNIILLDALAQANLGNRTRAKDLIVSLCTVYQFDYTAKYYARLIDEYDGGSELPLTVVMDGAERARRTETIETELSKAVNPVDFVRALELDEELNEIVMWGLYEGDDATALKTGRMISRTKNGFPIARRILLNPDCSVVLKKAVFLQLLKTGSVFVLSVVINDKMLSFHPILPKVTRRAELIDAYWQVYSALAFIESGYEKKLSRWYKQIAAVFENEKEKLNSNALAALIAYRSQANKIFELDTYCCEVFDCDYKDFMIYSKKLEGASLWKDDEKSIKPERKRLREKIDGKNASKEKK